jgi:hypothetical protein
MVPPIWLDVRSSRPIRLVPFVGVIVLLVRWLQEPRGGLSDAQRLHEHMELTDAWIVTLSTLLGVVVLLLLVAIVAKSGAPGGWPTP